MNFYLSNNGQAVGPYSVEQIMVFLRQGLVTTTDEVWCERWPSWISIGNVPGVISNQPISDSLETGGMTQDNANVIGEGVRLDVTSSGKIFDIVEPNVGKLYNLSSSRYISINGILYNTTANAQACKVFKTEGGHFAFKYQSGFFRGFGKSDIVVFARDAIAFGRLPDSYVSSNWSSCKMDIDSGGYAPLMLLAHVWDRVGGASGKENKKGIYVHFNNKKGKLEQMALLGDALLIDAIVSSLRE